MDGGTNGDEFEATPYEMQTIVQFPRILNLRRAEDLMSYVSANVPARVFYQAEIAGQFNEGITPQQEGYFSRSDKYVRDITGRITRFKPFAGTQFRFEHGGKSGRYFDSLVFETPGYDRLDEINPGELRLMDSVREAIDDYFAEHPRVKFNYGL